MCMCTRWGGTEEGWEKTCLRCCAGVDCWKNNCEKEAEAFHDVGLGNIEKSLDFICIPPY